MRTRFTAVALRDLKAIADWIAADRPNAARKIVGGLREACEALADRPYAFARLDGYEARGVRRAPYSRYVICYRVEEHDVLILRVFDGARDIPSLL
ncbi:type II toxin-antitoxin system RelE/ParE family toxin [uncultured Caulobacter sp.]|jgi:toxin ParE1/3/4|uniref:type II toxin-antitoxin system RelE/ParE family toxin n=1 Tax=uncultured Caulobacter sp. TaxID=158749 RepID=UPI00345C89E2